MVLWHEVMVAITTYSWETGIRASIDNVIWQNGFRIGIVTILAVNSVSQLVTLCAQYHS